MKKIILLIIIASLFASCNEAKEIEKTETVQEDHSEMGNDQRIYLKLNDMQKNHQKSIMRDHLAAVQEIVTLLSSDKYKEASELANERLGSTTKMKLMCASFGDENFEILGLEFHKSADKMSEVFLNNDKDAALKALSNTMNYCVKCHASYQQ